MVSLMDRHKYDVVIVGAGIVGTCMAYWLSKKGVRSIAVLERGIGPGNESTGKSAGGIRAQFSNEINIRMQIEAVKFYERFEKEIGGHIDFIQSGYLFMVTSEELKRSFEKNVELQRKLGLPVEGLTPAQVRARAPYVNVEDVLYGTFCPTDGYADPTGAAQALWTWTRERGIKYFFETEVRGVDAGGGLVRAVRTDRGSFEGSLFMNAAGAWSNELAKMAGTEVPVYPLRRMLFITKPIPEDVIPPVIPMTIDMDTGFYCRRESGGLLLGMEDDSEPPGFNLTLQWEWLETLIEKALPRIPALAQADIMRGWAGLYDQSPDHSAVLGRIPDFSNFFIASGFSGHGFMQAPVATKLVSELMVEGKASMDISSLRCERFKENQLVHEANVI
jgi:sarcosine oxidase subunit beta